MVSPELLEGLNPAQVEIVTTLDGPMLVVAGPGAGKTKALTHRVAALVESGISPYRILAVTFTNKAAREMRDRLEPLVGQEAVQSMWVATFHSACVRMLRLHHEAAGLSRNFTILDADDAKRLIKSAAQDEGLLEGLTPSEAKDLVKSYAEAISRAKNDGRSLDSLALTGPIGADAAKVWAAYARKLSLMHAVDFDDILLRTAILLARDEQVRDWAKKRFSHVLVDEYQDTNRVQEAITHYWGARGNICVVGDPDQSIYAFRGAAPAVMDSFTTTWPGAKVVILDRNYRSTGSICAVSRAVISANPAVHRAHTTTTEPDGAPVLVHSASDSDSEAAWVVSRIADRGEPWSDHAVLLRTAALSRPVENALRRRGIPYSITGGQSFYDRAEVKDTMAWLRLALNPSDQVSFARVCAAPKRGIGSTTVDKVSTYSIENQVSILDAVKAVADSTSRSANALNSLLEDLAKVVDALVDGPAAAVRVVFGPVGLRAHVAAISAKDGIDRLDNLDGILDEARAFDTSDRIVDVEGQVVKTLPGPARVLAFVENAALVSDTLAEEAEQAGPVVQLMTIHAAKGKEFPHVYVVGMEENVLPHSRSLESEGEVAEERRLAFVAVSRAQLTLALTHCRMRFWFGDERMNEPSRFLADLPEEHILPSNDTGAWASASRLPSTRNGGVNASSAGRFTAGQAGRKASARTVPLAGQKEKTVFRPSTVSKRDWGFVVGDSVSHPKFGDGIILSVEGDYLSIDFDGTERVFDASRAPLVKN